MIVNSDVIMECLNNRNIKKYKGEVIEEWTLFLDPFGVEVVTDKAVYQIYRTSTGEKFAERYSFKESDSKESEVSRIERNQSSGNSSG